MILVTVGTQVPFDRLVGAVDTWAAAHAGHEVVAQIGDGTVPRHITWVKRMAVDEFAAKARACRAIVSHAGIGTVLTALELGKPLVVMPRRADLHEHRNDHQMATARWLTGKPGLWVAHTDVELDEAIHEAFRFVPAARSSSPTTASLIQAIAAFIDA